jgi:pimeloyl-ACP methyl ester carboxylesterase
MPIAGGLYYFAFPGDNPPVVLIHGAGGTHLHWPAEIRRLPGRYVLAVDLPGHGKSIGCGLQTISAYTEAVLHWLEAVGLSRAVLSAFAG